MLISYRAVKSRETSRQFDVLSLTLGSSSRSIFVLEPPLDGLGAMHAIHLRLIGKLLVDFVLLIL